MPLAPWLTQHTHLFKAIIQENSFLALCDGFDCFDSTVNKLHYLNNLVEAHCYGKGMAGQFLSKHVAVKQIESKTFRL